MEKGNLLPLGLKIFIFAISLLIAFFILPGPVSAQSFSETFDDLSVGALHLQGGWFVTHGSPANSAYISTTTFHSSDKAVYFNASQSKKIAEKGELESRETGRISFWIYPISGDFYFWGNYDQFKLKIQGGVLELWATTGWVTLSTGANYNEWSLVQIEWDITGHLLRGKVDSNEWSDWTAEMGENFSAINSIYFIVPDDDHRAYLDDILYGEPWATMPVLTPTYPAVGTTTEITTGNFTATGQYWYDDLDPIEWLDLEIYFTGATSTYWFSTDISATNTATFTIPVVISDTGTFDVTYLFGGNSWEGCLYLPCYPRLIIHTPDLATTTVQIGEIGLPQWTEVPFIEYWEEEEPEAGTVQHFLWSIKNFLRGLILPSQEAQSNFLDKIRTIETKFPYNYIIEVNNFFSTTSENIEQDPTMEFGFLNATGTAQMSFFEPNITIGSETKTFYNWFQTIFKVILIGGFVVYSISFIRRIF